MQSPVVTLASSMRSLAAFESPELSRPRPRTLLFSPQNDRATDSPATPLLPTVASSLAAVRKDSESPVIAASVPVHFSYEGEQEPAKDWLAREGRLYDDVSCAVSPWRHGETHTLPTLMPTRDVAEARISCDTVARLIQGEFAHAIDDFFIVDCRYDYEHLGGHISGAVSVNKREHMRHYFEQLAAKLAGKANRTAIIFHCEFSQHRGPRGYRFFRDLDRQRNVYPHLTFPELYVMEGGYRQFYEAHNSLCWPSKYVPMNHPVLSKQWSTETAICRKSWKECVSRMGKRSKCSRRNRLQALSSPSSSSATSPMINRPLVPVFASPTGMA